MGWRLKNSLALGKRHGMRVNLGYILERRTGRSNEVVHNAQADFAHDVQVVGKQKVVILVDGAGQGVFNRRQAVLGLPGRHAFENGREGLARYYCDAPSQQFVRGFFAE